VRLIALVYDTLRTANRPCSRAEIESATGLDRDAVREGLRGLHRRRSIAISVCTLQPGTRGVQLYALQPGAIRPADQRGAYTRDNAHRERMAATKRLRQAVGPVCWIGVASPPSHHAEPGVLRVLKQHLRAAIADVPRFSLADLLKR
jgi:hypothetical protein